MIKQHMTEDHVIISDNLEGYLVTPLGAQAIILFAHGSGSNRYSLRNQLVANSLNKKSIATLVVNLLNSKEKRIDEETKHLRYDTRLLARRFEEVTEWLAQYPETKDLEIGYFGSSTGAAAALMTAEKLDVAKAIVTRGGRPDLVDETTLRNIRASTLFIVGGNDLPVIAMNKKAFESLHKAEAKDLAVIPNAGHLFEEHGKMEEVAQITADWFEYHLLRTPNSKFRNKYAKNSRFPIILSLCNRQLFRIRFNDRSAAGDILASILGRHKNDLNEVTVIGIARGGIILADRIAERLNSDFDIIFSRKLRSPYNSENAIGAIMHDGSSYFDTSALQLQIDISKEYIDREIVEQSQEMERRLKLYHPYPLDYKIKDRTVILVDDGIATGATMIASARWIRKQNPNQLVIAAPVAPKLVVERLKQEADQIEIIKIPSNFKTVEQFYRNFAVVPDHQIQKVLKNRRLIH